MTEPNVAGKSAEERDAFSDEHGNASDGDALNESGAEEALDGDAAVDVKVIGSSGCEF